MAFSQGAKECQSVQRAPRSTKSCILICIGMYAWAKLTVSPSAVDSRLQRALTSSVLHETRGCEFIASSSWHLVLTVMLQMFDETSLLDLPKMKTFDSLLYGLVYMLSFHEYYTNLLCAIYQPLCHIKE